MSRKTVVFSNPDDVDAKSLLGLMNLGFNKEIELKVYEDECQDLLQDIEKYLAA